MSVFRANHVVVDGPFPNSDGDDEYGEWVVQLMRDDEEGPTYRHSSYESAFKLGNQLAAEHRIELVVDASRS